MDILCQQNIKFLFLPAQLHQQNIFLLLAYSYACLLTTFPDLWLGKVADRCGGKHWAELQKALI